MTKYSTVGRNISWKSLGCKWKVIQQCIIHSLGLNTNAHHTFLMLICQHKAKTVNHFPSTQLIKCLWFYHNKCWKAQEVWILLKSTAEVYRPTQITQSVQRQCKWKWGDFIQDLPKRRCVFKSKNTFLSIMYCSRLNLLQQFSSVHTSKLQSAVIKAQDFILSNDVWLTWV